MNWKTRPRHNVLPFLQLALLISALIFFTGCTEKAGTHDPLTGEEREWLSQHDGNITLAHDPNARPIDFFDRDGNFDGLAKDYVRQIENRLNFKFNILKIPTWNQVVEKAKKRDVDVLCTFTKTPEREDWMLFTEPYITIKVVILTRDDFKGNLTLDAMKDRKVTFTKGWVVEDFLKKYKALDMLPASDEDAAMNNLITQKADAWVTALTVASVKINDNKISTIRIAGETDLAFKLAFASRKDWPVLNSILQKGLNLIPEKEKEKIFKKWINLQQESLLQNKNFWIVCGVILGALILLLIFIYFWNRTLTNKVSEKTEALNAELIERKKTEEALRQSRQKFRNIFDNASDAIFIHDMDGHFLEVNESACQRLGYSQEELLKMTPMDIDFKEMAKKVPERIEELRKKSRLVFESVHRRRDDTLIPVEINSRIIDYDGNPCVLSIVRDITERKDAEEERKILQSQLNQAQKMESIGNLAGGIAHDFNNILFPIIGLSELLMEDLPLESVQYENAQEILKAGKRGSDLVKQILAFSRQSEQKTMPLRIQQILKEVLKLTRATIPSSIEIAEKIQEDCGMVRANPTQIHQIAMNLITNAYQSIHKSTGKIALSLREIEIENVFSDDWLPNSGRYAQFSVTDNGVGIDPANLKKIFEPYFTTKEKGKGTGLGLAVVYGIIKNHNGDIKVYSEPGKGTTFNVYLPLMDKDVHVSPHIPNETLPTGNERILLVDDETSVLNLEKQILERLGYTVTESSSSSGALRIFKEKPDLFDLVITDMTMPGMPGDQLASEILSVREDMPVIICTGFSEKMDEPTAEHIGIKGFLTKPLVKSELAQTVRTVLDEATP